jgi:CubicO group peptidase (beta-lactamase class C family)
MIRKMMITAALMLSHMVIQAQHLPGRLDSLANFYHETLGFNGSVLVYEKGKLLLNRGYGYEDEARKVLNTADGVYLIGSVTKQFTAEVILMLASEGRLSLQDKLSKYYPDYAYGDKITVKNLLTHTSGIFDYTRDSAWEFDIDKPISDERLFSLWWNKPLNFEPGSEWSYSNTNYKLLGEIIGKVTGKSYYANVRERIFLPLGMTHSGFDFTHLSDQHKTVGYYRVSNDSFLVSIIVDSTQTNAAGGIYSTTADMLRWHKALQGYKLLPKAWQDQAYEPFKDGYAFGWQVDSISGEYAVSHSGHIHGYNANFCRLTGRDVCVVVLTNFMKTGADPIDYTRDIVHAMFDPGYKVPTIYREVMLADAVKERYVGVYSLVEDPELTFTFRLSKGQLLLQLPGQPEVPLLPASDTLFFTRVVDARIGFTKTNKDRYDMVLYQNGQELVAHKR